MGFHQTIIEGRLGRDVDVRHTQSGMAVGNFSVAVSYRKKKDGEWGEATKWYECVSFAKTAENCAAYLAKGSNVLVVGHLEDEKWTDKENNERVSTKLYVDNVQFLGGKSDKQAPQNQNQGGGGGGFAPSEDVPFAPFIY